MRIARLSTVSRSIPCLVYQETGGGDYPPAFRRGQTDTYGNITFPQLRLRAVNMSHADFLIIILI